MATTEATEFPRTQILRKQKAEAAEAAAAAEAAEAAGPLCLTECLAVGGG